MSTRFNANYNPPMPALRIRLGPPGQRPTFGPYDAILDTGADFTIIPESLAESISATALYPSSLSSQWGDKHAVNMFMVELELEFLQFPNIVVAGDPQADEIILGRNILNRLALFLDGAEEQTEILDDSMTKRLRARRG